MKDLIAVDLIIPPSVNFFGAKPQSSHATHPRRQKIRGKLRVVCSKPIRLRQVEIKFKGQAKLNWRDPQKGPHSLTAEKLEAVKLLRKIRQPLLKDATLPTGVTELGFEIPISGWLCQTHKSDYLTINYTAIAKLTPTGKFVSQPIRCERELMIHKTLVPKDVACGHVPGFVVPRIVMKGERSDVLKWKFSVPKWACLNEELSFEGTFIQGRNQCKISKIEVDVVQEEVYRSDTRYCPDQTGLDGTDYWMSDITSWFFPNHALPKRHLVSTHTNPSIYLHPPMDTPIPFTFPLKPVQVQVPSMPKLRRVQSAPLRTTNFMSSSPPTTRSTAQAISSMGYSRVQTICCKGNLLESLDSAFLRVRQYIRVVVHVSQPDGKSYPICIGLPIAITRIIKDTPDETAEGLPTYQSLARDAERLPGYSMSQVEIEDENTDDEQPSTSSRERSSRRRRCRNDHIDIDELPCEISDLAIGRPRAARSKSKTGHIVAAERHMDDFLVVLTA
ncbi:hypothetical protein INT43_006023 [Umbelopsis isabellina]|uniref:Arrestin-like N-terminal domain-containing protein n=1 Tax=Mortierella isabellina TaxID=91625 RepID=A0A8H7PKN7_MORIS|nr:hypothetical protein INT43_006023 [Umbelopsis isabellina]